MESQISVVDTRPDRTKTYDPPKPTLDRLIVQRISQEEQTGFAIPEKYRQHSSRGEVLAIGDGIALGGQWFPMNQFVNVGDIVKYGEYCAERLGPDDENTFVIRLQDVRYTEKLRG